MNDLLVDTGPLVALLNGADAYHAWAKEILSQVSPPVRTCEAVVSEACFVLRRVRGGSDAVLDLIERGAVKIDFSLRAELPMVRRLMKRFGDVPMSLADACLVRMTELDARATVLTLDGDFRIYRRNGRHVVPAILPEP